MGPWRPSSWPGEFTGEYFAQPPADPAAFGLPTEDDGVRDDHLLSDRSAAVLRLRPDADALAAAPTRIVVAVGEECLDTFTGRCAVATTDHLGQRATVFPSHHGCFLDGTYGWPGQPGAFAARLREVPAGHVGRRTSTLPAPEIRSRGAARMGRWRAPTGTSCACPGSARCSWSGSSRACRRPPPG